MVGNDEILADYGVEQEIEDVENVGCAGPNEFHRILSTALCCLLNGKVHFHNQD